MNEERVLRRLTAAARNDGPPVIDVSDRVIESVNRLSAPTNRLIVWFATAAAAAAMVITVLAMQAALVPPEPTSELLHALLAVTL